MTVCMIEYTAVPYIGQRRCSRYRFRLFDRFFFHGLSKAPSGTAAVLVDELDAGSFQSPTDRKIVRCSRRRSRAASEEGTLGPSAELCFQRSIICKRTPISPASSSLK